MCREGTPPWVRPADHRVRTVTRWGDSCDHSLRPGAVPFNRAKAEGSLCSWKSRVTRAGASTARPPQSLPQLAAKQVTEPQSTVLM